jgi:hypothetical protein
LRPTFLLASFPGRAAYIVVRGWLCSKIELARPVGRSSPMQVVQQKTQRSQMLRRVGK